MRAEVWAAKEFHFCIKGIKMSSQRRRLYFFLFAAEQSSVGAFNTLHK